MMLILFSSFYFYNLFELYIRIIDNVYLPINFGHDKATYIKIKLIVFHMQYDILNECKYNILERNKSIFHSKLLLLYVNIKL